MRRIALAAVALAALAVVAFVLEVLRLGRALQPDIAPAPLPVPEDDSDVVGPDPITIRHRLIVPTPGFVETTPHTTASAAWRN